MEKIGRNDPCPCGSGKKLKHCCIGKDADISLNPDAAAAPAPMTPAGAAGISTLMDMALEHQLAGQLQQAEALYRQALLIKPDYTEALVNLGNVLQAQTKFDEAVACYRQALSIRPDIAAIHYNLGNVLQDMERLEESIDCYRQAVSLQPDFAAAYSNLGTAFLAQGSPDKAAASCRQALLIQPDFSGAHCNLGNVLREQDRLDEAVACYRQALLIQPDYAEAFSNLGTALQAQGRPEEAAACFRQALLIRPDYTEAFSNLLFTLDLTAGVDTQTLQSERRRWSDAYAVPLRGTSAFTNNTDPERRLRIGYVSADFSKHSAAIGFGAMLTRFDDSVFDVFAYSNSTREDEYTLLFQQSVTCWRKISGLSDAAVADLIRQDGIDILVDLSGHSSGNRLLVFARKPAPLQITAWGYAGGTGMAAMDVLFSDPVIVPPDEKYLYAEDVCYLPCVISAFFPSPFPPVNSLTDSASLATRGVVFGSFNRLAKISAETFKAWAQILLAMPASRMVLKTPELDDAGTRNRIIGQFIQAGVDPERLILLGRTHWLGHVATFNQIDISLDPFPQSGGATTLEGLMMGVPVVTLRGNTFVGRGSASLLTTLGLTDWIAETQAQYVGIAVRMAQDRRALADLRQQLRSRFMASIIGDTEAYARVVEQEYRKLWRTWCLESHVLSSALPAGNW